MKSTQRQFLINVGAISTRTFSQIEGGEKTADTNEYYDGGSLTPNVMSGPTKISDITLTNAYDPDIDGPIVQGLKGQIGILRTPITVQPLYGDMTRATAKPNVYPDCLLKGVTPPAGNANSSDPATYQLVFAASDLT